MNRAHIARIAEARQEHVRADVRGVGNTATLWPRKLNLSELVDPNAVDPVRHSRLHHVEQGAQWAGQDDLLACEEWADEVEKWLVFVAEAGELGRYLPRLRSPPQKRGEALMELAAGYFLQSTCGLPVINCDADRRITIIVALLTLMEDSRGQ